MAQQVPVLTASLLGLGCLAVQHRGGEGAVITTISTTITATTTTTISITTTTNTSWQHSVPAAGRPFEMPPSSILIPERLPAVLVTWW